MDPIDYQSQTEPAPERARSRGGLALLISVVVLVLAGIGGALWYVRSRAVPPAPESSGAPAGAIVEMRDATPGEREASGLLPGTKVKILKTRYGESAVFVPPPDAPEVDTSKIPTHPEAPSPESK